MAGFQLRVVTDVEVGFYGKLPTHGDFLRRRASDAFVMAWDGWLQAGMSQSQATMGDRWLDVYLTSPAWRFVCDAGACGSAPVAGVFVPSIDRVGRYFPLTIVAQLWADVPLFTMATQATAFFNEAERLLVDTLAAEHVNFESFDARVAALREALLPLTTPEVLFDASAAAVLDGGNGWQLPLDSNGQVAPVFEQLLSRRLSALYQPLVLWWTDGSSIVDPSCLVCAGLPPASTFCAFLDGAWAQHRWRSVTAQVDRHEPPTDDLLGLGLGTELQVRSAAVTDVGRVRTINQDAFVERPDIGVWVVADGLGGHRDGEVASREVCDALAELTPSTDLDVMVQGALDRIEQVNAHLYRRSAQSVLIDRCGSTVVALLARGSRCAVLWAGDSRVYRWRAGQLERLTDDHSVADADPLTGRQEAHGITRAVGVAETVVVDVRREDLRAGDRFLLCSDGLTRIVTDEQVKERLAVPDLTAVVQGLVGLALEGGGPDNVTAVVAEAQAPDEIPH